MFCYIIDDSSRVFLWSTVQGCNDYINAIYIPVSNSGQRFQFEDPNVCLNNCNKKVKRKKERSFCQILLLQIGCRMTFCLCTPCYFQKCFFKNSSNLYRLLFFFIKSLIGWSFQNYRQRYAYIITEMPQVHTIIDFCRLLQQEECRTIVMLNSGFTDTQVHVQFRVCYSVIIIIPYEKLITN